MKTIAIDLVKAGMVVAHPITHRHFFVSRGAKLHTGLISRLRDAGISLVCVK